MAGPILNHIQRNTTDWVLQTRSPKPCRIMYGENKFLRHWQRGPFTTPWGGSRGDDIWHCYTYKRRSNDDISYAFATRGRTKEQFLFSNLRDINVPFTNESILAEDSIPETLFIHKVNQKLGRNQLILSTAETERCYLQMIPGVYGDVIVKGCEEPPDGISDFTICFATKGKC